MAIPWDTNYKRSYRVTVGTRQYNKQAHEVQITSVLQVGYLKPVTEDDLTVPSNARVMGNLTSEGYDSRGFNFKLNSVQAVGKSGGGEEQTLLTLYNLEDDLVEVINQPECVVMVDAGYEDKVEVAYVGDVIKVTTQKAGADTLYHLKCGAGATAMRDTLISVQYDETMSERDIIVDLVGRFPHSALGTVGLEESKDRYKTGGRSFIGDLVTVVDKQMARNNLNWGYFNGIITIIPFRLKGENYSHFARTNYNLPENSIKRITDLTDNTKASTSDVESQKRTLQVNTFFLPTEMGQFITIPSSQTTKKYHGTYQIIGKRTVLESKGQAWDSVLKVKEV